MFSKAKASVVQQIAPATGLLGTIAGYLLGKDQGRRREQNPQTPAAEGRSTSAAYDGDISSLRNFTTPAPY